MHPLMHPGRVPVPAPVFPGKRQYPDSAPTRTELLRGKRSSLHFVLYVKVSKVSRPMPAGYDEGWVGVGTLRIFSLCLVDGSVWVPGYWFFFRSWY